MDATAITQHDQLKNAARVWVAQTFYGQMLKQMRNSPWRSDLMDGGRGGQAFQAQLDQRLAERMTSGGAGERLVNSIVRRLERFQANPASSAQQSKTSTTQKEPAAHVATDLRA